MSIVKQSSAVNIWENEVTAAMSLLHALTSPSQVLIFAHTVHIHTQGKAFSHHLLCTHSLGAFFSSSQEAVSWGYIFVVMEAFIPAGQGFPGVAGEQRSVHNL